MNSEVVLSERGFLIFVMLTLKSVYVSADRGPVRNGPVILTVWFSPTLPNMQAV